jgi:hypothetical protein
LEVQDRSRQLSNSSMEKNNKQIRRFGRRNNIFSPMSLSPSVTLDTTLSYADNNNISPSSKSCSGADFSSVSTKKIDNEAITSNNVNNNIIDGGNGISKEKYDNKNSRSEDANFRDSFDAFDSLNIHNGPIKSFAPSENSFHALEDFYIEYNKQMSANENMNKVKLNIQKAKDLIDRNTYSISGNDQSVIANRTISSSRFKTKRRSKKQSLIK